MEGGRCSPRTRLYDVSMRAAPPVVTRLRNEPHSARMGVVAMSTSVNMGSYVNASTNPATAWLPNCSPSAIFLPSPTSTR